MINSIKKWIEGEQYIIVIECMNCKHIGNTKVPKGTTARQWIEKGKVKCPYCGCNTVKFEGVPNEEKEKRYPGDY